MDKISIVIPAYNEERRIKGTLDVYLDFFKKLRKKKVLDFEILVVMNACIDGTYEIVNKLSKKHKELKFLDFEKGGKGFAIIQGFKDALKRKKDFIGFVDADLATRPEAFYDLLKGIKGNDGVIASRYLRGSRVRPRPTIQRRIASRVFNIFIRGIMFLPYKDTQCGAKIFRRKPLEKIINKIGMTKWAFDVELLYRFRKAGFNIKEVPTIWSDKDYSTINFMESGPWMVLAIIRLRILNSPFRRFIRVYDKFTEIFR